MPKFNQVPLPEAKYKWARKTIDRKRFYVAEGLDETYRFPSITTVLGCRDRGWLFEWRNRVGAEQANRISRIASQTGTQLHKACENYLSNKEPFEVDKSEEVDPSDRVKVFLPMVVSRFNRFKTILNRIDNVYAQELMMASPKLGVAGTVDCIAEFDGALSVIDFKTSRREKSADNIKGYFTQETAYAVMFYETYGIPITNLVTLISVENGDDQVFISRPHDHIDYLKESIYMFNNGMSD